VEDYHAPGNSATGPRLTALAETGDYVNNWSDLLRSGKHGWIRELKENSRTHDDFRGGRSRQIELSILKEGSDIHLPSTTHITISGKEP